MIAIRPLAAETVAELRRMANAQFETPEFRALLDLPFTRERARVFTIHMARYIANRRDCWAYVQGGAPLEVKRLIWRHEQEELIEDPNVGTDHFTLATREARALGLSAEDIEQAEPLPGAVSAFYAWTYLAKDRPWLEGVAASSILELRNSGAVVVGGSLSSRIRRKLVEEAGLPAEGLVNQNRHSVADDEHATLLDHVVDKYVCTEQEKAQILRGAVDSLLVDRAFRGALAAALARIV